MLVLSRYEDEEVVIECGDMLIRVVIVTVKGDKVRLGFDAPPEVIINRLEVHEQRKLDADQIQQSE